MVLLFQRKPCAPSSDWALWGGTTRLRCENDGGKKHRVISLFFAVLFGYISLLLLFLRSLKNLSAGNFWWTHWDIRDALEWSWVWSLTCLITQLEFSVWHWKNSGWSWNAFCALVNLIYLEYFILETRVCAAVTSLTLRGDDWEVIAERVSFCLPRSHFPTNCWKTKLTNRRQRFTCFWHSFRIHKCSFPLVVQGTEHSIVLRMASSSVVLGSLIRKRSGTTRNGVAGASQNAHQWIPKV